MRMTASHPWVRVKELGGHEIARPPRFGGNGSSARHTVEITNYHAIAHGVAKREDGLTLWMTGSLVYLVSE
jgi:hypothetical protein